MIKLAYMKGKVDLKIIIGTPQKPIKKKELNLIWTHSYKNLISSRYKLKKDEEEE